MIGRLTGSVVDEQPNGTLLVDVSGVGYEVLAPAGTASKLTRNAKGESIVFVHTHVKAEAFDLYGFSH